MTYWLWFLLQWHLGERQETERERQITTKHWPATEAQLRGWLTPNNGLNHPQWLNAVRLLMTWMFIFLLELVIKEFHLTFVIPSSMFVFFLLTCSLQLCCIKSQTDSNIAASQRTNSHQHLALRLTLLWRTHPCACQWYRPWSGHRGMSETWSHHRLTFTHPCIIDSATSFVAARKNRPSCGTNSQWSVGSRVSSLWIWNVT